MIGKVPRPKVPRKGQGTRAKERREQEAAQRAATATINAMEAAAMDAPLHQGEGTMYQYPPIIEEDSAAASPSDSAIAWRPDFSLEGSVSSKSSPTNSWTELVGPFDASNNNNNNNEKVDPLDASATYESSLPPAHAHAHAHANYDYGVTTPFDGPAIVVDEYSGMVTQARFVGSPFHHQNHIGIGHSTMGSPQTHYMESTAIPHGGSYPPSMTKPIALPVSGMPVPVQKHTYIPMPVLDGNAGNMYYSAPVDVAASSANTSASNSNEYPMPTYTNCMAGGQVEAQFIFHDMDPTASYFDMPSICAGSAVAEYAW
ncbi:hypothetical protein FRC16_006265 [Serendipita sp. 398]|nr:hypothetical protein FRC16_006265 [Serendipita sp. 398]